MGRAHHLVSLIGDASYLAHTTGVFSPSDMPNGEFLSAAYDAANGALTALVSETLMGAEYSETIVADMRRRPNVRTAFVESVSSMLDEYDAFTVGICRIYLTPDDDSGSDIGYRVETSAGLGTTSEYFTHLVDALDGARQTTRAFSRV